jgi:hypothetical protein
LARQIFRKKFATHAYEEAPVSGLRQRVTLCSDRETKLLSDSLGVS